MRNMIVDDLVLTVSEIAELPEIKVVEHNGKRYTIHPQKIASMLCECADGEDDLINVMSQREQGKWYRIIHDGEKALFCECEFALHHENWCPNHLERAQQVIDKYRKRLGLDKEQKPKNPVQAVQGVTVEAQPKPKKEDTHRSDAPLARQQGFNILR